MNLPAQTLEALDNPTLSPNECVRLRCRFAAEFVDNGQYEAARDVLGELWQGVGERPRLEGCEKITRAEVLLRAGVISGWIGGCRRIAGSQEAAKDLISESLRLFEPLNEPLKVAEAQYELGVCYRRLGAFDEARVMLAAALKVAGESDDFLKAKILIRRAVVETWTCRYQEAWDALREAEPFFPLLNDAYKGRWHGQMALLLRRVGMAEGRTDYLDRAIIEYTAAIFHYEQAGHKRYCAGNLNNLAFLLYRLKRYSEAHEQLDRAREIYARHKDTSTVAQVDETRARVLIAEGRYGEAKNVIAAAVKVFEGSDEQHSLADALNIQATVLARLGEHEQSLALFRRAMQIAENAGASENAGQAALSLLEEHGDARLSPIEVDDAYRHADALLKHTQDLEDIARLRAGARIVGRRLRGPSLTDPDFYLPAAVHQYEASFIEEALERTEGKITPAAKLLGLKHHSKLSIILATRHCQLLHKRIPAVPRKRSIVRLRGRRDTQPRPSPTTRLVTILHAEDGELIANVVKEAFEEKGWRVETCADGGAALTQIESPARYDLLLFDNDLPGMGGLALIERARQLPHRRQTPVIMFSASPLTQEALAAGADAFLKKPEDMINLVATVERFIAGRRDADARHTPAPEIETERLLLRPFRLADLDALARLLSDSEVVKFLGVEAGQTYSRDEAAGILQHAIDSWHKRGYSRWAVVDKESEQFIGLCGLKTLDGEPELIYALAQDSWGQGFASEAATASLRYAFAELKFERVVAVTRHANLASQHVLQRIGMSYEQEVRLYGVEVVCYAITRREFQPDTAFYLLRR